MGGVTWRAALAGPSFQAEFIVSNSTARIEQAYEIAQGAYAELDVDVGVALERMKQIPLSLHCWQGDDVAGFEGLEQEIGGGLAVTGNYPGRARTPDELRADLEKALSLIPGNHRLNLHASYGEFQGQRVDRNEIEVKHYQGWIDWAKQTGLGLDFNPTYFAHENATDGLTLSHPDDGIRKFWIEHGIACRKIGAEMGRQLGTPCVTNVWIPDGMKDVPVDRKTPRVRLTHSLDAMFAEELDRRTIWTPWNASCLGSDLKATLSGRMSSTWVMRSHARRSFVWTRGTFIRPRSSRTNFRP